jgi:hypothetical protein
VWVPNQESKITQIARKYKFVQDNPCCSELWLVTHHIAPCLSLDGFQQSSSGDSHLHTSCAQLRESWTLPLRHPHDLSWCTPPQCPHNLQITVMKTSRDIATLPYCTSLHRWGLLLLLTH